MTIRRFSIIVAVAVLTAMPLTLFAAENWAGPVGTPPGNNANGPVWLGPGTAQDGDINISGGTHGDIYTRSGKSIHTDVPNGAATLNVGNYAINATGFTFQTKGDIKILGLAGDGSNGTLAVKTICLNSTASLSTNCITSWPSGGSGTIGGSGTTDYIPVFTAASTLGSSILRQGSGSLAIGATPDPGKTFNVQSSGIAIYGTGATYGVEGVGPTGVYGNGTIGVFGLGTTAGLQGSGPVGLLVNATDKGITSSGTNFSFYGATGILFNDGKVGIGTTSPSAKLTLSNNVASGFLDTYGEYQEILYDGGNAGASYGLGIKGSTVVFNSGAGAYSFDRGGNATTMVMSTAGNVGIGTTAPGRRLSVFTSAAEDGLQIDAPTYPEIMFSRSGGTKGYLGIAGSAGGYAAGTLADSVILRSENALHLISNGGVMGPTVYNGNLGIGITTPGSPLEVQGIRSGTHSAVIYGRDNLTGYELYGLSQNASFITSGPNSTYVELAGISGAVYARSESAYGTGVFGYGNGAGTGGYSGTSNGVGGHFENTYDQYNYNTADLGGYGYGLTAVGTNYGVRSDSANYSFYGNSGRLYNAGNAMIGTLSNSSAITLGIGDSDTGLHSAGDGALDVYSNGVRTMSVRSGNVGLGTNDPYLAGMSNTLGVSRGAGGIYGLGMNYTGAWYMSIITEGQKRLTIMDGGKIGIGKTDPGFPLTVYGPNDTSSLGLMQYNDASAGWSMKAASDGSLYFYRVVSNNSENYRSKMDQNTGAYSQASDRDLKQDISKLTKYGMDDLMKLEPVTYSFKDDASHTEQVGFIAQDVQKIMPEFVSGKSVKDGGDGLSINYAGFVPVITKGMQEQQKEIDALKAQNEELMKRLEALEAKAGK